jgi:hypothetical protein
MTARRVHAVLAAGVQSPNLIDRWRTDPRALGAHGLEPSSFDLAALWKFSGFTTKVRHNGVRNLLPMSFRLMAVAGVEIDFFASYASFCAANGTTYTGTLDERCDKLVAYAQRWLDPSRNEHALLWDLIRHERALATLAEPPAAAGDSAPPRAGVPRVNGRLLLHEMRSDPSATAAALAQRDPVLDNAGEEPRYYGYWRPDGAGDVQIVELDAFGYYALANADGVRSAGELSAALGLGAQPAPTFLRCLRQLADAGIIRFEPLPEATRA